MKRSICKLLNIGLFTVLVGCSGPEDTTVILSQAKHAIQEGKSSEAGIYLKNILQNDPNHEEARLLLGEIYLEASNFVSAEKELEKAHNVNPENENTKLLLAKTKLLLSKFDQVLETLIDASFTSTEDQIYSLLLQGQANLSLEQIAEAKENIQEANDLSSTSKHSMLGNAFIATFESGHLEALQIIEELIQEQRSFEEAWLLKGSILSNIGRYGESAEAYVEYHKLRPENFGVQTIIAHNYTRAGDFINAKIHIEELRAITQTHPTVNTIAAQIAYMEGNFEHAKNLAQDVISSTNNSLATMIAGLSDYKLRNDEQAYSSLSSIRDALPNDHKVHKVLAVLQVRLGYNNSLTTSLKDFDATPENSDVYAQLGAELLERGLRDEAIEMFKKAEHLAPNNAAIKAQLGILKLKNIDASGIEELVEAVEIAPDFKVANINLAMTYWKNGDIEKAIEVADNWLEKTPNNNAAIILRGNLAMKSGDTTRATQYFKQASDNDDKDLTSLFNLAVIAAEHTKYEESNRYLDRLLSINVEYPMAYRLAINNALHTDSEKELKNKLSQIIEDKPESIWPRVILSRKLVIEEKFEKALNLFQINVPFADLPNIYFESFAATLLKSNDLKGLEELYLNWQGSQPTNEIAYLHQAKFFDDQNNFEAALNIILKALSISSLKTNFDLHSFEAYYMFKTNQIESASKKVNILLESTPGNSFLLRIKGQIALLRKDYEEAVTYLTKSYQKNKKEDVGIMIVNSYEAMKMNSSAIKFLSKEKDTFGSSPVFGKLLAQLYISNEPKKAIDGYLDILDKYPTDLVTLNNLAWTYYEQAQYESALNYSEKAVKLAPKNANIIDTYGMILFKLNKIETAIENLELAHSLNTKDTNIKQHLDMVRAKVKSN